MSIHLSDDTWGARKLYFNSYTYIFYVRICVSAIIAMLIGTVVNHCNLAVALCSTIHVKCVMQCKVVIYPVLFCIFCNSVCDYIIYAYNDI